MAGVALLACICLCLVVTATAAPLPAAWRSGVATWTGSKDPNAPATSTGACGYGNMTQNTYNLLAGISFSNSPLANKTLKGCGTCIEVQCTNKEACTGSAKSVVVMVFDDCGNCSSNQINLLAKPFSQLAALTKGVVPIQYREVPCNRTGGIVVHVVNFRASAGGWVRLVFKNVNANDVKAVQIAKAGSSEFKPMTNVFGAAWEASVLPSLPWDIRLTNAGGQSILLKSAVTSDSTGEYKSAVNF